jgi:hypothetical protein
MDIIRKIPDQYMLPENSSNMKVPMEVPGTYKRQAPPQQVIDRFQASTKTFRGADPEPTKGFYGDPNRIPRKPH